VSWVEILAYWFPLHLSENMCTMVLLTIYATTAQYYLFYV